MDKKELISKKETKSGLKESVRKLFKGAFAVFEKQVFGCSLPKIAESLLNIKDPKEIEEALKKLVEQEILVCEGRDWYQKNGKNIVCVDRYPDENGNLKISGERIHWWRNKGVCFHNVERVFDKSTSKISNERIDEFRRNGNISKRVEKTLDENGVLRISREQKYEYGLLEGVEKTLDENGVL
ncbi:hypothetical protein KAI54_01530, partial [Candidatus Gracilibacteria bacterium]|nr:hypothetical protein [Candidatus Gracilibacteria bacterium]